MGKIFLPYERISVPKSCDFGYVAKLRESVLRGSPNVAEFAQIRGYTPLLFRVGNFCSSVKNLDLRREIGYHLVAVRNPFLF